MTDWISDNIAYVLIEYLLVFLTLVCFLINRNAQQKAKTAAASCAIDRGEVSMGVLWAGWGSVFGILAMITQDALTEAETKIAFYFLNLVLVSYLFFFNGWFRNSVFKLRQHSMKLRREVLICAKAAREAALVRGQKRNSTSAFAGRPVFSAYVNFHRSSTAN